MKLLYYAVPDIRHGILKTAKTQEQHPNNEPYDCKYKTFSLEK